MKYITRLSGRRDIKPQQYANSDQRDEMWPVPRTKAAFMALRRGCMKTLIVPTHTVGTVCCTVDQFYSPHSALTRCNNGVSDSSLQS